MKTTLTEFDFINGFKGSYENNFSYEGKIALFEYLTQYEDDLNTEIEFDPIALCCEFTEYENLKEIKENYDNIKTMQDLEDNTQVIKFDGGIIIQDF